MLRHLAVLVAAATVNADRNVVFSGLASNATNETSSASQEDSGKLGYAGMQDVYKKLKEASKSFGEQPLQSKAEAVIKASKDFASALGDERAQQKDMNSAVEALHRVVGVEQHKHAEDVKNELQHGADVAMGEALEGQLHEELHGTDESDLGTDEQAKANKLPDAKLTRSATQEDLSQVGDNKNSSLMEASRSEEPGLMPKMTGWAG